MIRVPRHDRRRAVKLLCKHGAHQHVGPGRTAEAEQQIGTGAGDGIMPVGSIFGRPDWYATSNFGWPEVASRIAALETDHSVGFVVTTRYSVVTLRAFFQSSVREVPLLRLTPAAEQDLFEIWTYIATDNLAAADR